MKVFLLICTLLLLAGCSEPVQTEPFLNGSLEVGLQPCPVDGPCDFWIGTLNLQAQGLGSNRYSFSGALNADSETFTLEGEDAFGTVTGTLTDQNSSVYTLLGVVNYDREEAESPTQTEPSGQLVALCKEEPCAYRSINIGILERTTP